MSWLTCVGCGLESFKPPHSAMVVYMACFTRPKHMPRHQGSRSRATIIMFMVQERPLSAQCSSEIYDHMASS